MYKCNEDSCSQEEQEEQVSIERGLVVESLIEVDHLICSICHHIVWDPIACGEQFGCQNAFCSSCINAWLRKCQSEQREAPLCPQCKRTFVRSKIPPILKSVLQSLRLKCPHSDLGCPQILAYLKVEQHIQKCEYKCRTCRGCKVEVLSRDYEKHLNECASYIISCGFCGGNMPKFLYIAQHIQIQNQNGKYHRSYNCYENEIAQLGDKVDNIQQTIQELNQRCNKLQNLTTSLVVGQALDLNISFYTTFSSHFSFPNPTLIKPSFNQSKQKFDFLHFYIVNPIYTNSFASLKWTIKINKMIGNILLGFCSNMNINSLDYIVNKYGELKRKDIHQSKYKIVRKNEFSFTQGDIIRCRYLSLLRVIRLQNETKKQTMQLSSLQIEQFSQSGKIYIFLSLDTLNDSISFL